MCHPLELMLNVDDRMRRRASSYVADMKELVNTANVNEWWKYRPGIAEPSGSGLFNSVATGNGWHAEGPLVLAFGGGSATVDTRLSPDYYR